MPKAVLAALLTALLALPAAAQGVRVTLTDGTSVAGELEGFEQGRYRIRLAGGALREIDERLVRDISLTDTHAAPARAVGGPAEDARAAFDRGDYEGALARVAAALAELDRRRSELALLATRSAQAILDGLIEKRDAAGLAETLRRLKAALPPDARRDLLTRLADGLGEQFRSSPSSPFTLSLAEMLARLSDEGTIAEPMRQALADRFVQLAKEASAKKAHSSAAALYRGAARVDPRRAESLREPVAAELLAHARALLEAGVDLRAAADAAREAAAALPANAEAARLAGDAEFAWIRQEVESTYGAEAAAVLRDYLARNPRAEHRAWAETALKQVGLQPDPRSAEVAAQMHRYFPVKSGRFMAYRRGGGDILERVKVESLAREDNVLRVHYVLEEKYRDYTVRKAYPLEIEKDAVVKVSGREREILLRFPLREGDSWTWTSGGRSFRRTVRSTNATAATGQAEARRTWTGCVEVDFTSTSDREGVLTTLTSRSTYAPGVGLVKLEFVDDNEEHRKFGLELVEYGMESRP